MYVTDDCTLCESCFLVCPAGAIYEDEEKGRAAVLEAACVNCGVCMGECPTGAIRKGKPPREAAPQPAEDEKESKEPERKTMYEEYQNPFPDVSAYLARIGLGEAPEQTAEGLDQMVLRHQYSVPFEDLDQCLFRRPIAVTPDGLFKKIVQERRGGFCFEQNLTFFYVLRELGWDSAPVPCRVAWGWDEPGPISHCAVLTRLPGEDFCRYTDVGFGGPQPAGSVRLIDGCETEVLGEIWIPRKTENGPWWNLYRRRGDGSEEHLMQFSEERYRPQEFISLCFFYAESERSPFRSFPMLNLRTETGSIALTGDKLTIRDGENVTEETVPDEAALLAAAEKYYGIRRPED